MNGNITVAALNGKTSCKTAPLYQYDYGQVLQITGVDLPQAYEVHFGNAPRGESTTQIGNADGVIIPDAYLTTGSPIYAWIYLHTGNDDGETEYVITIPVNKRAAITNQEPTPVQQDAITEAIAALNDAVEQTAQDVIDTNAAKEAAEAARDQITSMSATATTLAPGSSATASYANGVLSLGVPRGDQGDKGDKGDTGATPDLTIGTVSTLPAGSSATATITGTAEAPVLNLGIPKGDQGEVSQAELSALSAGLTSDLDLVQTSGTIVETEDAFPTFAEDVTSEIVPVQSGSGDPSPENVRPITGFDGVKVTRTGKNLLNPDGSYFAVGREYQYGSGAVSVIRNADGSYHIWTNGNSVRVDLPIYTVSTNTGIVVPTGDYTFTIYGNDDVSSIVHLCGSGVGNGLNGMAYFGVTKTATRTCLDGNAPLSYLFFRIFAGDPFDINVHIQMEVGTDSTAYEPYNGIQVELPFGRTVYGGTVDLTTGKLTVTHAHALLNDPTKWVTSTSSTTPFVYNEYFTDRAKYTDSYTGLVCSYANVNSATQNNTARWSGATSNTFGFNLSSTSITIDDIKAAAQNGEIEIMYPLATPQVYDLTPAQVLLLRDYNVLWANTGDIINLEYRAGSFVSKKTYDALKETTLIHSTASGAIASFADGAEMPVDEVTVQINPVQDLHGYDHPWPGGGGKNLADTRNIEGTLTESQYTELRTMLAEQTPVKTYDVEGELDKVWVELRRIASIVDSMPEPSPEPEPSEDVPDWVQPTGAHDAYQKGDKVRYNGNVYESLIDGNVWSPDAYPAGWQKLVQ